MGRSYFLTVLVISVLLALSSSQELEKVVTTFEEEDSNVLLEENIEKEREMMEVMDYKDPEPNTNPKTRYMLSPPPPTPPPQG